MSRLSTAAGYAAALSLLAALLVGCDDDGDDDSEDRAEASVLACRSFFLGGGAGGEGLEVDLRSILENGSYEPTPLLAQVKEVRQGASEAGSVPELTDADYQLFRAVVLATARIEGDILAAVDTRGIDAESVEALTGALAAVGSRCG